MYDMKKKRKNVNNMFIIKYSLVEPSERAQCELHISRINISFTDRLAHRPKAVLYYRRKFVRRNP